MRTRTRLFVIAAALVVAAALTSAAVAVSPHLKGNHPLAFTDNGLTLSGTASYAGLGNFDTLQVLSATGDPTADCVNPGSGEHRPPGQQPAEITLTGATAVPVSDIKNGNVTIATTTDAPVTPVPGAPGCPNENWTENIVDMAFTSATISVYQDSNENGSFEAGELVLTVSVSFSPATSDGAVPESGFSYSVS